MTLQFWLWKVSLLPRMMMVMVAMMATLTAEVLVWVHRSQSGSIIFFLSPPSSLTFFSPLCLLLPSRSPHLFVFPHHEEIFQNSIISLLCHHQAYPPKGRGRRCVVNAFHQTEQTPWPGAGWGLACIGEWMSAFWQNDEQICRAQRTSGNAPFLVVF